MYIWQAIAREHWEELGPRGPRLSVADVDHDLFFDESRKPPH